MQFATLQPKSPVQNVAPLAQSMTHFFLSFSFPPHLYIIIMIIFAAKIIRRRSMTQEELTRRIQSIDIDTLKRMSPRGIAVLTDGFKEALVREIICTQGTNYAQRELWEAVRTAYHQYRSDTVLWKTWGEFPKVEAVYPEFMAQIDFDLECGRIITRDGSIQEKKTILRIPDPAVYMAKILEQSLSSLNEGESEESVAMTEQPLGNLLPSDAADADDPEQSRLKKENEILKAENERLRNDVEAYREQGKGLTASEAAVFLTALCHHHKQIPQNGRENLAPLMAKIWGFTEATSRSALRSRITQDRADKVAKHINGWVPAIASIIIKLPPVLENEKIERLRAQNPKKNVNNI